MSKLNDARMARLSDKIYEQEAEKEQKRKTKPRRRLLTKRGSGRTSRLKKGK